MSYKFGDLSLLLSNKKIDNNVKLIKTEFKLTKKEVTSESPMKPKDITNTNPKKKNKRKSNDEIITSKPTKKTKTEVKSPAKSDKVKPKKNKQKSVENISVKQNKKKKRKLKPGKSSQDHENNEENRNIEAESTENTLVQNEDDSNTDDEENEPKPKKVENQQPRPVNPDVDKRTIFIGNWPIKMEKKHLKREFKKYGTIETVRFRSVPVGDIRIPKKVTAITKQFHPDRTSTNAYVQFSDETSAHKALAANGTSVQDHHLRVTLSTSNGEPDPNKALFVGNIHFQVEDDDLWKLFSNCGDIESVKIIRDPKTGIGKGVGFVNFKSTDGVELALKMGEVSIKDRPLRLQRVHKKKMKKEKENKRLEGKKAQLSNGDAYQRRKQKKNKDFQGLKFTQKLKNKMKKSKPNKRLQKKPFKK